MICDVVPGESLTYITSGAFGSVRSPIGVSTLTGVVCAVQLPGAQVSAFRTTVTRFFCAMTRSGAGSSGVQPGAPAARLALSADQQAKVIARDRAPSVVLVTAVSTVWPAIAPF